MPGTEGAQEIYVDELLTEHGPAHSLVCSSLLGVQKVRQQIGGEDMMGKYKLVF